MGLRENKAAAPGFTPIYPDRREGVEKAAGRHDTHTLTYLIRSTLAPRIFPVFSSSSASLACASLNS
jgi:hypothetical protein